MRKIAIILMIFLVFALSGCIKTEKPSEAFAGGTEGLELEFENMPETIFVGNPFEIALLVKNVGETNIPEHEAYFILNNAEIFSINASKGEHIKNNSEELKGAQKIGSSLLPGGRAVYIWDANFTGVVLTEKQKLPISVDACYKYSTLATSKVCIGTSNKVCEPIGEKPVQNSGAPIHITKLKQIAQPTNSGVKLRLIIEVENKGSGTCYSSDANCKSLSIEKQDLVNITSIIIGGTNYAPNNYCTADSISLYKGKGSVTCNIPITAKSDYETQLTAQLEYVYKQKLSTTIEAIPP